MDRREILKGGASLLALAAGGLTPRLAFGAAPTLPAGVIAEQILEALPGKVPLIKKTFRPPNYETPLEYLNDPLTRNDAFFVRYHLANVPQVDASTWRLSVGGPGAATPLELSLDDLKANYEKVELVAVNQCSGNRRGFADPHVGGVQWGYGAIGNARWGGVRLKDILANAGLAAETIEISFNGADGPVLEPTPDFIKSVPLWKAMDENTLIAFEMNGEPLPHWNGFPARVVVPGWTGTYWMKHVVSITALTEPERNFWMATAYRIPKGAFPVVQRFVSQEAPNGANTPITEIVVNSLVTNLLDGATIPVGQSTTVRGIAWDGGYGIAEVMVSVDGGSNWSAAVLGEDMGKYSWRQWTYEFTPRVAGPTQVKVRARNNAGETQVDRYIANGPGYNHNVVQTLDLVAA